MSVRHAMIPYPSELKGLKQVHAAHLYLSQARHKWRDTRVNNQEAGPHSCPPVHQSTSPLFSTHPEPFCGGVLSLLLLKPSNSSRNRLLTLCWKVDV